VNADLVGKVVNIASRCAGFINKQFDGNLCASVQTDVFDAMTAMAGEMLGLKCIYLDAGSGARHAISPVMVRAVRDAIQLPLIIGGGLRSPDEVARTVRAGADIVVIGTAVEKNVHSLSAFVEAVHQHRATAAIKKEQP